MGLPAHHDGPWIAARTGVASHSISVGQEQTNNKAEGKEQKHESGLMIKTGVII